MKTKYLLIIFFIVVAFGIVSWQFFKRDPVQIIEATYSINLGNFDYSKKFFEEQWHPNGDGASTIILKLNKFTKENGAYLHSIAEELPIEGHFSLLNELPSGHANAKKGYYIYLNSKSDSRNFNLLIIDLDKMEIFSYIQVY